MVYGICGLGLTLTRKQTEVVVKELLVPTTGPFVLNEAKVAELDITPDALARARSLDSLARRRAARRRDAIRASVLSWRLPT